MSTYYTIPESSEGFYKEKGSKFIALAVPVESEEEVEEELSKIRKKYHDARHHCYGYIYGLSDQAWRSNDDGEPSHSAGDPILGQIRSFELTNVLVVVVRYFGGTKLGVGGLVKAYRTAAELALEAAGRVEVYDELLVQFDFPYELVSAVERIISEMNFRNVDRDFKENCRISATLRKDLYSELERRTADLYNLELKVTQ